MAPESLGATGGVHGHALANFALGTSLGYDIFFSYETTSRDLNAHCGGIEASLIAQEPLCLSSHHLPGDAPTAGGRGCCRTHLQALSSKTPIHGSWWSVAEKCTHAVPKSL